ncbi:GntR family transcriptional regulator, partial [Collinsella sp.]
VQSQQGKGVRVIRDPTLDVSRGYDGLETFNEMAARLNFTPTTRCLVLEDLTADEDLARLTGFPAGSELTHVLRVRIADGKALSTDESYYLSSVVEGLTPPIVEGGIYRFLEGERRIKIATSRRIITVEGVTEQDERCIDLDGFNAVSVMRSHTFDLEGIMVEYTETRQRPETFSQYSTTIRTR